MNYFDQPLIWVLVAFFSIVAVAGPASAEELTRNELTSTAIDVGSNLTAIDAGSDTALLDDRTFLFVRKNDTNTATITITAQQSEYNTERYGNLTISDLTFDVNDGDSIVQVPTGYANDNGRMELSYSGDTTELNVGVFKRKRR